MFFCKNSQRVKAVGCFRGRAPSLMLDGILNSKLPLLPNSLDSHQTQNNKNMSWTDLSPSFPSRKTHQLGR